LFTPADRSRRIPEREMERTRSDGKTIEERSHLRKDGSRLWVFGSLNPLNDEGGNLIGYVKVACDATDRKRAEEALKESEAEFRAIFEMAGTGKAEADLDSGRLLRVNQKLCEITGFSAEELLGMTIQELTHPEDRGKDLREFQRLARSKEGYAFEKRYLRKDGSDVWTHVNVIALHD